METKKQKIEKFPEHIASFYTVKDKKKHLGVDCCAVCGIKTSLFECSTCKNILYCSEKHQVCVSNFSVHELVSDTDIYFGLMALNCCFSGTALAYWS